MRAARRCAEPTGAPYTDQIQPTGSRNGRGFATVRETLNAVEAWLGSLPGNPYANVRPPIVHTLNLAHMMPVSAVWAGPEMNRHLNAPPPMMTESGSTPFRLDLHGGGVGHTPVVGPTRAGKVRAPLAARPAVPTFHRGACASPQMTIRHRSVAGTRQHFR
jgi:hypothetical protein